MAREVFISFLGTNNYLETYYELGGRKCSHPVRYIQEALLELTCEGWTADDNIYIFGTNGSEGSHDKNWIDNGHKEPNGNVIELPGLDSQLKAMSLATPHDFEFIPEGFSRDDVWKMMEIITSKLERGDEIHLDVTHAFRSIPMLATTLFNYTQFMLDTTLACVHYGAFEKLGPLYKVKQIPVEQRIAPIVDMTDIVRLQDFTEAASSLTVHGRIKKISNQLSQIGSQMQRKYQNIINQVGREIEKLDNYITTCRINDIRKGAYKRAISNNLKSLKKLSIPMPIKELVVLIEQETSDFVPEDSNANIEAAITWARKYEMLSQAYTLAREYICIRTTEVFSPYSDQFNPDEDHKEYREFVSSLLNIDQKDADNENFKFGLASHIELTKKLLHDDFITQLRPFYKRLSDARNIIDHGKGNQDWKYFVKEFENYSSCLNLLKQYVQED